LADISFRLRPNWVKAFLVAPTRFGVAPTNMPAQFYRGNADGSGLKELITRPAERVQQLTDYLFSLQTEKRDALVQKFATAKVSFPEANAAKGEMIFRSLNCAACHRHSQIGPRLAEAAPGLAKESRCVTRGWLENYLKHPTAVRPFGYRPGDGSRMPDFFFTDGEAKELGNFLSTASETALALPHFEPEPLSAFSKSKALALLQEKLSCLGCHRLGEQGGRIGPDLTRVRERLQPDYVHAVIQNPRGVHPHTVMPRIPLTPEMTRLISNFLLQQDLKGPPTSYLSPLDHSLIPLAAEIEGPASSGTAKPNYLKYCAACHGHDGRGDGFNARFLARAPTVHADPGYMTTRPDDTLYDGISSGGYILNKSPFMPPWGGSLAPREIKELVEHLRTLCRCRGPAWSSDNVTGR
jgi:mono/diheme cytochrome c family protein